MEGNALLRLWPFARPHIRGLSFSLFTGFAMMGAGLAIPRSTLAQWVGSCGVQLQPLVDAMKAELLEQSVLHADETPVAMLDPGAGKTHRAYLWTYCSTALQATRLVVLPALVTRLAGVKLPMPPGAASTRSGRANTG